MSGNRVEARWTQGLRFETVGKAGVPVVVDGDTAAGPSPMEAVLTGVATCMGADVVTILDKMRVPFEALTVEAEGDRRSEPPRYYTAIRLVYQVTGMAEEHAEKLERAVDMSRDTYCSALHSLRPDVDISIRIETG